MQPAVYTQHPHALYVQHFQVGSHCSMACKQRTHWSNRLMKHDCSHSGPLLYTKFGSQMSGV